jgi:hypothetical protein
MNIQQYRISNLLGYQVDELKRILQPDIITFVPNPQAPHFHDAYAGLNSTEYEILERLGYSIQKHIIIGAGVRCVNISTVALDKTARTSSRGSSAKS